MTFNQQQSQQSAAASRPETGLQQLKQGFESNTERLSSMEATVAQLAEDVKACPTQLTAQKALGIRHTTLADAVWTTAGSAASPRRGRASASQRQLSSAFTGVKSCYCDGRGLACQQHLVFACGVDEPQPFHQLLPAAASHVWMLTDKLQSQLRQAGHPLRTR